MRAAYKTLDNGNRPFLVRIAGEEVTVYKNADKKRQNPILAVVSDQILIGTCDHYGPKFDGNSIVVREKGSENLYYHIGIDIFKFHTAGPIIEYWSRVGNSGVPYPWAQDEAGNVYLMIEEVVLLPTPELEELPEGADMEPYTFYYDRLYFNYTHNGRHFPKVKYSFEPGPNYDSVKAYIERKEDEGETCDWLDLGREAYIQACQEHEQKMGIRAFVRVILTERQD